MSSCWPITIFPKWTLYCWWSLPYKSSLCQSVDLSPFLHTISKQYVTYTLRHIYVNQSTCHHLYKRTLCCWWSMLNILSICQSVNLSPSLQCGHFIVGDLFPLMHQYINLSTCHSRQYVRYTLRHIYMSTCRSVTILTKWTLCWWWSIPISYQYVMSTCYHLYKVATLWFAL